MFSLVFRRFFCLIHSLEENFLFLFDSWFVYINSVILHKETFHSPTLFFIAISRHFIRVYATQSIIRVFA